MCYESHREQWTTKADLQLGRKLKGNQVKGHYWLVVSTQLKNISQIRSFPQVGKKIKKYLKPPPRLVLNHWITFFQGMISNYTLWFWRYFEDSKGFQIAPHLVGKCESSRAPNRFKQFLFKRDSIIVVPEGVPFICTRTEIISSCISCRPLPTQASGA